MDHNDELPFDLTEEVRIGWWCKQGSDKEVWRTNTGVPPTTALSTVRAS